MFHNPPTKAWRVALLAAVAVATLAVASRGRADLWIQNYAASRNDRFYSGADKAFIGQPYDWSGVGQQGGVYWATMISPEYFISANHYHPALGGTLTFYEDNTYNHPHTFTVDSSWSANDGDLFLGRLTAPIPAADHIT